MRDDNTMRSVRPPELHNLTEHHLDLGDARLVWSSKIHANLTKLIAIIMLPT